MNGELSLGIDLGEEEIAALRAELVFLSELVATQEMEKDEIRTDLARFQSKYYRSVGRLYVELDELKARVAEKKAQRDDQFVSEAFRRRSRAQRTAGEYRTWQEGPEPPAEPSIPPSDDSKKLYRRIAALIHPDKAHDEASRSVRTDLMAALNAAYAKGDIESMRRILELWQQSPEAVSGDTPAAEKMRLHRTIARVKAKISQIEAEIEQMKNSPAYRLLRRVQEAAAQGRDLLAELTAEIERQIRLAREELAEL